MEDKKASLKNAAHSTAGKFAVAYTLTALSGPVRLALTAVALPVLARKLAALNSPLLNKVLLRNTLVERLVSGGGPWALLSKPS
jgi:hypothetical protein